MINVRGPSYNKDEIQRVFEELVEEVTGQGQLAMQRFIETYFFTQEADLVDTLRSMTQIAPGDRLMVSYIAKRLEERTHAG